ncbi:MAG: transketolase [Selenomonadaceae bacterium]|nr:transketolase [Selenomonadaceae bacterium]
MNLDEMNEKCRQLKLKTLQMCVKAGYGHVTSAFSCSEILVALYYNLMNIDKNNPSWEERDRFVMSKNHASIMLYPVFEDLGWINQNDLNDFGQDDSLLGGHSKMSIVGVDFAGGSLGIGLGVACGMAYGNKADGKSLKTYCIIGDGECYEGSIWESAMFAGHNKLSNLVVFLDRNRLCMTAVNENILSQESLFDKWRAFGWYVDRIDGHDIAKIISAVKKSFSENVEGKPVCIICDTIKGHGVDFMEDQVFMHGWVPKGEKAEIALKQLGGAENE